MEGRIEAVIHLGACSATTEADCDYLMRNNLEYSKAMCRFAQERNARFIYASSAATYGDGGRGLDTITNAGTVTSTAQATASCAKADTAEASG